MDRIKIAKHIVKIAKELLGGFTSNRYRRRDDSFTEKKNRNNPPARTYSFSFEYIESMRKAAFRFEADMKRSYNDVKSMAALYNKTVLHAGNQNFQEDTTDYSISVGNMKTHYETIGANMHAECMGDAVENFVFSQTAEREQKNRNIFEMPEIAGFNYTIDFVPVGTYRKDEKNFEPVTKQIEVIGTYNIYKLRLDVTLSLRTEGVSNDYEFVSNEDFTVYYGGEPAVKSPRTFSSIIEGMKDGIDTKMAKMAKSNKGIRRIASAFDGAFRKCLMKFSSMLMRNAE